MVARTLGAGVTLGAMAVQAGLGIAANHILSKCARAAPQAASQDRPRVHPAVPLSLPPCLPCPTAPASTALSTAPQGGRPV